MRLAPLNNLTSNYSPGVHPDQCDKDGSLALKPVIGKPCRL